MRTIAWRCTAKPTWQWRSGSPGNPRISVDKDGIREGLITLPPNRDYWYPCVELALQGATTTGNAYLCYFQENGVDKIQATTVAQGVWLHSGDVGKESSKSNGGGGGIELEVFLQGGRQSPIQLSSSVSYKISDKTEPWFVIKWQSPLSGVVVEHGQSVIIKFNDPRRNGITLNGKFFQIDHFHLHGPAEHTFAGEAAPRPIELHVVHVAADGTRAVVAIFFDGSGTMALDEGAPFLSDLLAQLTAIKEGRPPLPITTNVHELLPANYDYYRYEGSLTTAPYSENVSWVVLSTPKPQPATIIESLQKNFSELPRPVQPLNNRLVLRTFD